MAWEIKGTTGSLDLACNTGFKSKISAPKNPKLIKESKKVKKVCVKKFEIYKHT